jgi:beta-phosphoglucomutase
MTSLPGAVIFDMDGVIIDSEPLHEKAQRIVFANNDLQVPVSVYTDFKGQTEKDVFSYVVREFGNESHDERDLVAEKHAVYSRLMDEMKPVEGAIAFIDFLAGLGIRLALTTSAIRDNQVKAFELFRLQPYFEVVVTAEDVSRPKPHPEPYVMTASRMGVRVENCLVIEDSVNGVRSALEAGCKVAALTTSFSADILRNAGADSVHASFAGLQESFNGA